MDNQSSDLSPQTPGTPSSPSTEVKDDYMSSYTQIESSTYEPSQLTELSSSSGSTSEPELDEEIQQMNLSDVENTLPRLSSQIVEWSKERFDSYDDHSKDLGVDIKDPHLRDLIRNCNDSLGKKIELNYVNKQILEDLENYSNKLSINVNQIMSFIKMTSNEITKNSLKSIGTFQKTQNDLAESVDMNIKLMYRVIAQCEEMDKSMQFAEELAKKIRSIRQIVENFEKLLESSSS